MDQLTNFIGGQFVPPQEGRFLDKICPIHGQLIYELPDSTEVDVVQAVRAAHKAYGEWSALPLQARLDSLTRLTERLNTAQDELALADTLDTGVSLSLSRQNLNDALTAFKVTLQLASVGALSIAGQPTGDLLKYELRQSVGVAGVITSYGEGLAVLLAQLGPALACGNTVVVKPSEFQSHSAWQLAGLLRDMNFPAGVCNFVFGRGEPVGSYLVRHPGVPRLSFTGTSASGEKVRAAAAPYAKRLNLSLGCKNSALIFKDADLSKAVAAVARGAFLNPHGESLRVAKILVQEDLFKEVSEQLTEAVLAFKMGDPRVEPLTVPPVRSEDELLTVERWVQTVRKEDGKILCGGSRPANRPEALGGGFYLSPTLVADLTNCSEIHQTDVPGPLVTINPFKYPHEAVKWANNTPFGRHACLWTKSLSLALKVARDLEVGHVTVNGEPALSSAGLGGLKSSGGARTDAATALEFYSQQKTVDVHF